MYKTHNNSFLLAGFRLLAVSLKLKTLEAKVKEPEHRVGQKQVQIDYLEKMIDIAKDDLNIDIKKNSAPHHYRIVL